MENEIQLNEEIARQLELMKGVDVGSEEYRAIADGVAKLIDRSIEMNKTHVEAVEKEKDRQESKIDRWIKHGLTAAGIVLPAALTAWGVLKTFEFEKEGTVTTGIGRGFIGKLLPRL